MEAGVDADTTTSMVIVYISMCPLFGTIKELGLQFGNSTQVELQSVHSFCCKK